MKTEEEYKEECRLAETETTLWKAGSTLRPKIQNEASVSIQETPESLENLEQGNNLIRAGLLRKKWICCQEGRGKRRKYNEKLNITLETKWVTLKANV